MLKYLFIAPGEELPTAMVYDEEDGDLADQMRETRKQRPVIDVGARDERVESRSNGELHGIAKVEQQLIPTEPRGRRELQDPNEVGRGDDHAVPTNVPAVESSGDIADLLGEQDCHR